MRQTSRAVALLLALESAQAVDTVAIALASGNQIAVIAANDVIVTTNNNALTDRRSPYAQGTGSTALGANLGANAMSWGLLGLAASSNCNLANSATALTQTTRTASQPCMSCLNNGSVWCSRTYSYSNTTDTTSTASSTTLLDNAALIPTSQATTVAGAADAGTCCGTNAQFITWVGFLGQAAAPPIYGAGTSAATDSDYAGGVPFVPMGCVAAGISTAGDLTGGSSTTKFGQSVFDVVATAYTSWWCSNGLYKTVTALSSNAGTSNISTIIPMSNNKRLELAQVACPQTSANCGTANVQELVNTTAVAEIQMAKALATFTLNDKCTWVAHSVLYAPTFTMSAGTTDAIATGLTTSNWVLHHMEYTTDTAAYSETKGSLRTSGSSTGIYQVTDATNPLNFVPLFNMPAQQFATLRTWYGKGYLADGTKAVGAGALVAENMDWYAPYQQSALSATLYTNVMSQYYGNVANFPSSTYSATTPAAGSSASYGLSTNQFDARVVRYFPALVAQNTHATGTALSTLYAGKLTSYNTAKATWDAYVAILAKNAKTDAFAAAFSPPKAPTVPPLPNMPWAPATYTGYLKQTPSEAASQLGNTGATWVSATQPTNQQFWYSITAAQSIGGWGSFTATVLKYRSGFGKSFGTIGYSGDSTNQDMSQVWNYKWMCAANTSAVQPSKACDATYAATTANLAPTTASQTSTNTTKFVVVITLWSAGNLEGGSATTSAWSTKQSFGLTWKASAFSNTLQGLSAIAAPTAATAASSLTGLAGAQALAASTAAALAAAAALY